MRRTVRVIAGVGALVCGAVTLVSPVASGAAGGPAVREFPPGTAAAKLPVGIAWGNNVPGILGDGTTEERLAPVLIDGGGVLVGHEVAATDMGSNHACALSEGAVYCWGFNDHGQLGTGGPQDLNPVLAPVKVKGLLSGHVVTAISAGQDFTCAVADGQPYCWGSGTDGELGTGFFQDSKVPVKVDTTGVLAGKAVSAITTGKSHACVIAGGRAYCWGTNFYGELGRGGKVGSPIPVAVDATGALNGRIVTSIAAGRFHSCVTADGRVFCWGRNDHGELGADTGNKDFADRPVAVDTNGALVQTTVKAVAAGGDDTCVIAGQNDKRQAFCWGDNAQMQVGDGTLVDRHAPVAVNTAGVLASKNISSITVNGSGGCVVASGRGYCWGNDVNGWGHNGTGDKAPSAVPVAVNIQGVLAGRTVLMLSAEEARTSGVAVTTPVFTDVPAAYTFADDIFWLAGMGTSLGFADGKFQPTADISRQAMAAFLFRFRNPGLLDPVCDPMKDRVFTDVAVDAPFCGPIEWLAGAGITAGGGKFNPVDGVKRAVLAAWIYRSQNPRLADLKCFGQERLFNDVPASVSTCGDVEWLVRGGITNGFPDGFHPNDVVHRDAMAAFFHRVSALTSH